MWNCLAFYLSFYTFYPYTFLELIVCFWGLVSAVTTGCRVPQTTACASHSGLLKKKTNFGIPRNDNTANNDEKRNDIVQT